MSTWRLTVQSLEFSIFAKLSNTDFIDPEEKFKFIDDLSIIEVLNLINIGQSSYNFHVASDIGVENSYLDASNIKAQTYLDKIAEWTKENEMKLNDKKSKFMIFNFYKKY